MANLIEGNVGFGAGGLVLTSVRLLNSRGEGTLACRIGQLLKIEITARAARAVKRPNLGFALNALAGELVYSVSALNLGAALADLASGDICHAAFELEIALAPGIYALTVLAAEMSEQPDSNAGLHHDTRERICLIEVQTTDAPLSFDGVGQLSASVTQMLLPMAQDGLA